MQESSQEKNMQALNRLLKVFLKEQRLQLHCRTLTLNSIGADALKSFACGTWNKGQDSVTLMRFMPWLLRRLGLDVQQGRPWKYLYAGSLGVQRTMGILYSEGVFLGREQALKAAEGGYTFLNAYTKLVEHSMQFERHMLFNLVPKLHYLAHVMLELVQSVNMNGSVRPLNPLAHSTAQCEDFIGRIARISRRVKPSYAHSRVIRGYRALTDKLGFLD